MLSIIFDVGAPAIFKAEASSKTAIATNSTSAASRTISDPLSEIESKRSSEAIGKIARTQLNSAESTPESAVKPSINKAFHQEISLHHSISGPVLWKFRLISKIGVNTSISASFTVAENLMTDASQVTVSKSHWDSKIENTKIQFLTIIKARTFLDHPLGQTKDRSEFINYLIYACNSRIQYYEQDIKRVNEVIEKQLKLRSVFEQDLASKKNDFANNMAFEIDNQLIKLYKEIHQCNENLSIAEKQLNELNLLVLNSALPLPAFARIELEQTIHQSLAFEDYDEKAIRKRITDCEEFIKFRSLKAMVKCLSARVLNLPELGKIPTYSINALIRGQSIGIIPHVEAVKEDVVGYYIWDDAGTQITSSLDDCHLTDSVTPLLGQSVNSSESEWKEWSAAFNAANCSQGLNILLFKCSKVSNQHNPGGKIILENSISTPDGAFKSSYQGYYNYTPNSAVFIRITKVFDQAVGACAGGAVTK